MSSYLGGDRIALASPSASDGLLAAITGGPAGVAAGTTAVMPAAPLSPHRVWRGGQHEHARANWARSMSASRRRTVRQP